MNRNSNQAAIALGAIAIGFVSMPALATEGPYVGAEGGANKAGTQTYDYDGSRTATGTAQAPVPVEQGLTGNSGDPVADYKYKLSPMFGYVGGYSWSNGVRAEFELNFRTDKPKSIDYTNPTTTTNPTDSVGSTQGDTHHVQLATTGAFGNAWYDFLPSWSLHPYVGGGLGVLRFKLANFRENVTSTLENTDTSTANLGKYVGTRKTDDATIGYQGGAGLRYDFTDYLTIGLDYRYVRSVSQAKFYVYRLQPETHFDAKYDTQSLLLSVDWYFFKKPAPVAPPAPPPVAVAAPPPDSDGDGVIDDNDKCPGTPHGTPVDNVGCPLPPPPPPCKAPAAGERVSLAGCGTGDIIVLRGVNFDFDKARLTPNAKLILDNVSDELVANPQINVELSGHTDSKGTHAYNQRLSEQRAKSVVKYLTEHGIDAHRMTAVGYGETQPVADNSTDEGRELNRRVELKIVGSSADGSMAVPPPPAPAAADVAPPADANAVTAAPTDSAPADSSLSSVPVTP